MTDITIVIEFCPETGLLVGHVPGVPGLHTQAATVDELHANLSEVTELLASGAGADQDPPADFDAHSMQASMPSGGSEG
jgi:predicted RNase H-like HicB family nuclease